MHFAVYCLARARNLAIQSGMMRSPEDINCRQSQPMSLGLARRLVNWHVVR